jgi:iron complex transport system substrate-binding protein
MTATPIDPSFRTRKRGIFVSLALAVALASGCATGTGGEPSATTSPTPSASASASPAPSPSPSEAAFPVEITDDEGTVVEIAEEPEVIVSLTPAITETLFALGVGDRIVGKAEDIFLYPPEAGDIPDVAKFDDVDVEAIVAAEPDLVFAGGNFFTSPDAIVRMRELGLNVVVLYAPSIETAFRDIELVGDAIDRGDEADAIVDRIQDEFDAIAAAVEAEPEPRVFYEIQLFEGTIYGPADESFLAEMITLAGAEPITTGSADKFDISLERLIQADPEIILLADGPFGVTADQVKERAGWDVMTAVRNDEIRPIEDQTVTRPGPRLFLGLHLLASTIHEDLTIPETSPIPAIPSPAAAP